MHAWEKASWSVINRPIKWLKLLLTFSSQLCICSNNLPMLPLDNILSTLCLHFAGPSFSSSLPSLSLYLSLVFHLSDLPLFRLIPVALRNTTKIPATLCKHTILSVGILSVCLSLKQTQQYFEEKKHLLYTLLETMLSVAFSAVSMNSSSIFLFKSDLLSHCLFTLQYYVQFWWPQYKKDL